MMKKFFIFTALLFLAHPSKSDIESAKKAVESIKTNLGVEGRIEITGIEVNMGIPITLLGPPDNPYEKTLNDSEGKTYEFKILSPNKLTFNINKITNELIYFHWSGAIKQTTKSLRAKPNLTEKDCLEKAISWLKSVNSPLSPSTVLTKVEQTPGAFSFEWSESKKMGNYQILIPPSTSMKVDYFSGKIGSYIRRNFKPTHSEFKPEYSQEEAVKFASNIISNYKIPGQFPGGGPGLLRRLFLRVADVPGYQGKPFSNKLVWNIGFYGGWLGGLDENKKPLPFKGTPPAPGKGFVDWNITLNDGGDVLYGMPRVRFEDMPRTTVRVANQHLSPIWKSPTELLYVSSNRIKGEPLPNPDELAPEPDPKVLCLAELPATGGVKTTALFQFQRGLHRGSPQAAWSSQRGFTWSDGGGIWVVKPETGFLTQAHPGDRIYRMNPAWDAQGQWLATSGSYSPSDKVDDQDIFIFNVRDRPALFGMENQRSIARFPGLDLLPVWNPKSPSIAFIHQEKDEKWGLYTVEVGELMATGKKATPEKILEVSATERLSFFPDGKRILRGGIDDKNVSMLEIINLETKTRAPLKMPVLRDADLPKSVPLKMSEVIISPDGKKIAFSALRWTGNLKDDGAICIYICNLDGTGLKRISPAASAVLEPFKYPQAGVTALNAWEKLQPKSAAPVAFDPDSPNTPGSRAYLEAMQRKIEAERIAKDKEYFDKIGLKLEGETPKPAVETPATPAPQPKTAPIPAAPTAPVGPMAPW